MAHRNILLFNRWKIDPNHLCQPCTSGKREQNFGFSTFAIDSSSKGRAMEDRYWKNPNSVSLMAAFYSLTYDGKFFIDDNTKRVSDLAKYNYKEIKKLLVEREFDKMIEEGVRRTDSGDYHGALGCFNYALEQNPYDIVAVLRRSKLHDMMGNRDSSIKDAEWVLDMDPDNKEAAFLYGRKEISQQAPPVSYQNTISSLEKRLRDEEKEDQKKSKKAKKIYKSEKKDKKSKKKHKKRDKKH